MWFTEECRIPILFFGLQSTTSATLSLVTCLLSRVLVSLLLLCIFIYYFLKSTCSSLILNCFCNQMKPSVKPPCDCEACPGSAEVLCLTFLCSWPSMFVPSGEHCSFVSGSLSERVAHLSCRSSQACMETQFFKHCCSVTHPLPDDILCTHANVNKKRLGCNCTVALCKMGLVIAGRLIPCDLWKDVLWVCAFVNRYKQLMKHSLSALKADINILSATFI